MGCMQSTPVNEPVSAAPASNKSAPASAPASQSAALPEPEVEVTPLSAKDQKYKISGVSITDAGVVYYVVEAVDGSVSVKHRYNDFKALYAALGQQSGLPALPEAGVHTLFRGKHSQELLKEREAQFTLILNAIAGTPALHESAAFQKFLA